MVFHPARALAAPHSVHGRGSWLVYLFSDWLHHLSCAHRRKVLRIQWLARGDLLSCPRFPRSVGVCDAAARHFNAYPGVSTAVGPAQADRALDHPDLAVCICDRSPCVSDALPMVPSACALKACVSAGFGVLA